MFAWWGRTVYQYRYIVIGVMVALCLGGGVYGISLGQHVTQSGFYDDGSQSVHASVISDEVYGRDRTSHVVAILTPPDGEKVDNPEWMEKVTGELNDVVAEHEDRIVSWVGWLRAPDPRSAPGRGKPAGSRTAPRRRSAPRCRPRAGCPGPPSG